MYLNVKRCVSLQNGQPNSWMGMTKRCKHDPWVPAKVFEHKKKSEVSTLVTKDAIQIFSTIKKPSPPPPPPPKNNNNKLWPNN